MASVLLSTLINRMSRYQSIRSIEQSDQVRDLDEAIRTVRRQTQFPWSLRKGSLTVFDGVLEYPVASDHDELAYLDTSKDVIYSERMRGRYTSLQEFYEDLDNRNDIAEIFDNGTRYLGVRYKSLNIGTTLVNNGETASDWTASGTASAPTAETVVFKEGQGSTRFTVTAGDATMTLAFGAINDGDYRRKYFFIWVYLDAAPASITLRFGNDASNYIASAALTTQYSGQAFAADQWNLLALDLNRAATGTIDSAAFDYAAVILTTAVAGTYYVDASYVREWELIDMWYYSNFSVLLTGSSTPNQQFFMDTNEVYSTDSSLNGDLEFADLILYEAIATGLADKENDKLWPKMKAKRDEAFAAMMAQYPSLKPLAITTRWRFQTEYDDV